MFSGPPPVTDPCPTPIPPNFPSASAREIAGIMLRNRCRPPFSTLLQPEMLMDGVKSGWCDELLMPRSHQTSFRSWNFRGLCWEIGVAQHFSHYCSRSMLMCDVISGWCDHSHHAPITPMFPSGPGYEICWGVCWEIDVSPPLSTLLQPEMLTDGARSGQCDKPLSD